MAENTLDDFFPNPTVPQRESRLTPEQIARLLAGTPPSELDAAPPAQTDVPAGLPTAEQLNPLNAAPKFQMANPLPSEPPSVAPPGNPGDSIAAYTNPPTREPESFTRDNPPGPFAPREPVSFERGAPVQQTSVKTSYSGPRSPSRFAKLEAEGDALMRQKRAQEAAAESAIGAIKSAAVAEEEARQASFHQDYEAARQRLDALNQKREAMLDHLSRVEIDPDRYFRSKSAAGQAALGISMVMGAMAQARLGLDYNPGVKALDAAIDRDIQAQRAQLEARGMAATGYGGMANDEMQKTSLMRLMDATKREAYWGMIGRKIDAEATKRGVDIGNTTLQQVLNEVEKRREMARMQAEATQRSMIVQEAKNKQKQRMELAEKTLVAAVANKSLTGRELPQVMESTMAWVEGDPRARAVDTTLAPPVNEGGAQAGKYGAGAQEASLRGATQAIQTAKQLTATVKQAGITDLLSSKLPYTLQTRLAQEIDNTQKGLFPVLKNFTDGMSSEKDRDTIIEGYMPRIGDSPQEMERKIQMIEQLVTGTMTQQTFNTFSSALSAQGKAELLEMAKKARSGG